MDSGARDVTQMAQAGQTQGRKQQCRGEGGEQSRKHCGREGVKALSSEDKLGRSPWEKGPTDSSCPGLQRVFPQTREQNVFKSFPEELPGRDPSQGGVWYGRGALSAKLACQPASLRGNGLFLSFWFVSHLVFLLAFSKGSKECSTLAQLCQEKIREKWF